MKVVGAMGYALRRVLVNSVVRKLVMFSNVIVAIGFPRRSFVFSQSSCEVSASLTDRHSLWRRANALNVSLPCDTLPPTNTTVSLETYPL